MRAFTEKLLPPMPSTLYSRRSNKVNLQLLMAAGTHNVRICVLFYRLSETGISKTVRTLQVLLR